jgi:hypothetical protein
MPRKIFERKRSETITGERKKFLNVIYSSMTGDYIKEHAMDRQER